MSWECPCGRCAGDGPPEPRLVRKRDKLGRFKGHGTFKSAWEYDYP